MSACPTTASQMLCKPACFRRTSAQRSPAQNQRFMTISTSPPKCCWKSGRFPKAVIGALTAEVYLQARKACACLLVIRETVLRLGLDLTVWKDVKAIDTASGDTSNISEFSVIGQAIHASIEFKVSVANLVKRHVHLTQQTPDPLRNGSGLSVWEVAPSGKLCEVLKKHVRKFVSVPQHDAAQHHERVRSVCGQCVGRIGYQLPKLWRTAFLLATNKNFNVH